MLLVSLARTMLTFPLLYCLSCSGAPGPALWGNHLYKKDTESIFQHLFFLAKAAEQDSGISAPTIASKEDTEPEVNMPSMVRTPATETPCLGHCILFGKETLSLFCLFANR